MLACYIRVLDDSLDAVLIAVLNYSYHRKHVAKNSFTRSIA